MRRVVVVAVVLTALVSGLADVAPAAASGGTGGTLTPSITTIPIGGRFSAEATGCPLLTGEASERGYRDVALTVVNGVGAQARVASGTGRDGVLTIPGWVDPSRPTVLRGACVRSAYDSGQVSSEVEFRYADIPLQITAATDPEPKSPVVRPLRRSAAGGQVLRVLVSGCGAGDYVTVVVLEPGFDGWQQPVVLAAGAAQQQSRSAFVVEVPLLANPYLDADPEDDLPPAPAGPALLPEGEYSVLGVCDQDLDGVEHDGDSAEWLSAAQPFRVAGTSPSESITANPGPADHTVVLSGSGCTGGRGVTATFWGATDLDEVWRLGARIVRPRAAPETERQFREVLRTAPDPDGGWALTWRSPDAGFSARVTVDCGRADGDGFRYLTPLVSGRAHTADVWVGRTTPTSARAGDVVAVLVSGDCPSGAGLELIDDEGRSVLVVPVPGDLTQSRARATFAAPGVAGTYALRGRCGEEVGRPTPYEVFEPTALADAAPLPAPPDAGWPVSGRSEVFHGRIGPISLAAVDGGSGHHHSADKLSTTGPATTAVASTDGPARPEGLSSTGYGVAVPRPAGDFAITKMTFGLVDEHGRPVGQDAAHLHHFVVGNLNEANPACPQRTFGLPGRPVVAAGAELTAIDFGRAPYGQVVDAADDWSGVYHVMSRSSEPQKVFLTYDLTIRRDVENVRPVTPYFGSASGCSSSSWSIDGSGKPDTQSTYVTIADDGVLVGGGAHLHNGARDAVLSNDRGRVLCRPTPRFGTEPIGHGADPDVAPEPDDEGYVRIPEFYADDPQLLGVSTCRMQERVRTGERLRFDVTYDNDRPRIGVMGIFSFYVWEGGGPADP